MNLLGILAKVSTFAFINYDFNLNFISDYIGWLIKITGNVGLGIILFTLTLRLIVLPFDIISKVKMKKNSVKMEAMRPELERLQKQYANDKNLYQQKMMAIQKKNGYSPLSGCLPMILSLVIFIIAINAFRTYSAVSMTEEYNDIVNFYNLSVKELTVDGENKSLYTVDGDIISLNNSAFYDGIDGIYADYNGIKTVIEKTETDGAVSFALKIDADGKFTDAGATGFLDKLKADFDKEGVDFKYKNYFEKGENGYSFVYREEKDEAAKETLRNSAISEVFELIENSYINEKILPVVNEKVKDYYEKGEITTSSFLWVKNIWMPDVSYEHPISPTAGEFQSKISAAATQSCTCSCQGVKIPVDETTYNYVTAGLSEQKSQANGYFIMVALSILTTFLSQFIMQKMQKAQLELQSADGQAAMTQKMMMWMMPIMFGFFAFSYSTAFSIYMTVSSIVTTLSSVIINVIVEKNITLSKMEEKASRSKKEINRIEQEKAEAEKKAKEAADEKERKRQEKLQKKNKK